ncbi:MAG: hypothetical protein KGL39_41315 [Patescibacteria group bacterium]|nr:hypothetical protein [Patescibacteria group bacterium]
MSAQNPVSVSWVECKECEAATTPLMVEDAREQRFFAEMVMDGWYSSAGRPKCPYCGSENIRILQAKGTPVEAAE